MTEGEYLSGLQSIESYLRYVGHRRMWAVVLKHILLFVIGLSTIICAALFLDLVLFLGSPARLVVRVLCIAVGVGVGIRLAVRSIFACRRVATVAFLERRFEIFKGRLFAATECSPEDPQFSKTLVHANIQDTNAVIATLPGIPVVERSHRILRRIAYVPLLLIISLLVLVPQTSLPTISRIFCGKSPFPTRFVIHPGNGFVERGYGFDIILFSVSGRVSNPHVLLHDRRIPLQKRSRDTYTCTVDRVEWPFTYQVAFSDTVSRPFFVDVVEHPRIADIMFTIRFPAYTGEKSQQTHEFDLYALKGSTVSLKGMSSQPLKQATLFFDDSLVIPAQIDSVHFSSSFEVDTTRCFTLKLVGEKGLENADRPTFRIFSFPDELPKVEFVQPGKDVDLPQELALDLILAASDDYGIGKLQIIWEQKGEKHTVPLAVGANSQGGEFSFHWDLMNLPLFPGDTLTYYAEVCDNDYVSGPKKSRTRSFMVRFPTAEEIYEEVAGGGEKLQEAFETESGKLDELKEGLKELEQSLRESRNLSWEERKKAEEIIQKEQQLLENIEQAREEMEELAKRINEAFLSNPEIREKLEEIERLMKELATEEIKHHMEELQKAMEKMDRREMLKAMENMILSQEEIKKKLERTIQILERIAQEERFEKIVEKVEELKEEQKRINREMENEKSGLQELSEAESALQEALQELSEEMEDLAREIPQSDSTARESLEGGQELSEELAKQLNELQDAMKGGQQQQSVSLGAQSEERLGELSAILSAGLSSMMSKRRSDLEKQFNALINDVIFLSSESEKIMHALKEVYEAEAILAKEDGLKDGTQKAIEALDYLKTKSPFISQIAEEELYRAIQFVEQSEGNIAKGNSQGAALYAKRAMKSLNLAALELIESKQDMPASGSSSLSQMLQQLQSLASGQMQINQGTQTLFPIDVSGGSVPEQTGRELQRLSELQSSLAEWLRRIEEGLEEEGGDALGDLGKVADEMEEVAEKLAQYSLDRELVERQERILSRMLDAQRSVHKREFSKQREAERPGMVSGKRPPPLPGTSEQLKNLRKDILKELEEKYPREYRDLIRAYFDKLLEEGAN